MIQKDGLSHQLQCCIAALHTVSFVHGCFAGKCILTGSTEYRYFKVDGSVEKKWDSAIPADLKRLFVNLIFMDPCIVDYSVEIPTRYL